MGKVGLDRLGTAREADPDVLPKDRRQRWAVQLVNRQTGALRRGSTPKGARDPLEDTTVPSRHRGDERMGVCALAAA